MAVSKTYKFRTFGPRGLGRYRIIDISSVFGKLVTPANGIYWATKFALEALSDAMRLELASFGIQVVVIEPGSIKTQFHDTVESNAQAIFFNISSPCRLLYEQYQKVTADMRRQAPRPFPEPSNGPWRSPIQKLDMLQAFHGLGN